jgi:hypothetical protein
MFVLGRARWLSFFGSKRGTGAGWRDGCLRRANEAMLAELATKPGKPQDESMNKGLLTKGKACSIRAQ